MFSKKMTNKSTNACLAQINRLKEKMEKADAVIIGAGAGLSTSAGFTYSGERFNRYFSDFIAKYGFSDMYSGGFYPFETLNEHWAYWSRYIYINRYQDAPRPVYENLLKLVKDKDYFVLTTNVDHCFQKAGFDKKRLFYTQGDYGLFQCSKPCCSETFDNEVQIHQMMKEQENMRIPDYLIPLCPHCGAPLSMNLRADSTFVEDKGWHAAASRYDDCCLAGCFLCLYQSWTDRNSIGNPEQVHRHFKGCRRSDKKFAYRYLIQSKKHPKQKFQYRLQSESHHQELLLYWKISFRIFYQELSR